MALREVLNAIFYVQRSGCQWEMLPHDFSPHQTVYKCLSLSGRLRQLKWQRKGIWQTVHDELRAEVRREMNREEDSSVAIADSQSVKMTEKADATPRRFPALGNAHQVRGPSTVLTAARKLKAVSAILS